jgi:cellulose synthase operon protein C
MAHLRGALLLLLLATGAACAPPPPASSPSKPLEVNYAGCKAVLVPGPFCVLDPARGLRLWVGAPPDAGIEIRVDGKRIDTAAELIGDGQRFSLTLPSGAQRLDVLATALGNQEPWSLSFGKPEALQRDLQGEIRRTVLRVDENIRSRQLSTAHEALSSLETSEAPAESRFFESYYRGALAQREGDYRGALDELEKAAETAERLNLGDYKRMAEEVLALVLREVGRSRESAEIFKRLNDTAQGAIPQVQARLLNNQAWSALLAREAGEAFRDPTPLLERAIETYAACGCATAEARADVLHNLALAHLQEGRLSRAKDLLAQAREIEPHGPVPHTLWRLDLEARIARREGRPAEALSLFGDLEELASDTGSPDGRLRAAFGQAQSHRALGDQAAALATLREAEALLDAQSLQVPVHEGRETFVATRQAIVSFHLELLLDRGQVAEALETARRAQSRVLRQLAHADRLASLPSDERAEWTRLLMSYQERRAVLEARAKDEWKLPADQRRHERAARRLEAEAVKKLLDEAFLIIGERPEEERLPPRPGEVLLVYHPLSRGGWVGFAADGRSVTARRFELPPSVPSRPTPELSRALLHPFRAAIRKADRIRVLASGRLQGVDFHALPFDGDVLLASAPVVYGLDLPVSVAPAPSPERRALLVADPRNDLPGALAEARKVAAILRSGSRPWTTEELKGAEASPETVQDRLAAADLLHYAGHGTFSGLGGWESSLLLAKETQLTLLDLLALERRVPAWVVLSSCNTGRSSTEIPMSGLGLAQAFLLAGSRQVVASTRPAADREMPAFFSELYQQWNREIDFAVALQRAQLSWRKRAPGEDWTSFRLFEP